MDTFNKENYLKGKVKKRNVGNIKMQLNRAINNQLRIGESRHKAKQEYRDYCKANNIKANNSYAEGIFSIATADAYRKTANEFGEYLKKQNIKWLEDITPEIAYNYLKEKENNNNSAWTVSKDMAAINKMLNLGLNKADGNLSSRRQEDVIRSRDKDFNNLKYNPDNYKDTILLANAFGLRKSSFNIKNKENYILKKGLSIYQSKLDNKIYIRTIEKGGKYREAVCLDKYEDQVLSMFQVDKGYPMDKNTFKQVYKTLEEPLITNYTPEIDIHYYRSEYATNLYNQYVETNKLENDYQNKYNYEALKFTSNNLGHNRVSVVIESYLNI